ncbi:MAG: hypothetical protein KME33_09135 [Aetokthonos hydrillicola CCALA 1050]|nr:hypothetical protein [Aetokthonos hydrillicola CCALA 1050]MBW4585373.1 hypothetical protein [Aetokthonos hydrillicola CCALA 1050]
MRVAAISKIWGLTVGIVAVSIPVSIANETGVVIPIAAIGGASLSSVAIWRSDDQKSKNRHLQQRQIELLEQRIANLETIIGSNDLDLERKIQQLKLPDNKT